MRAEELTRIKIEQLVTYIIEHRMKLMDNKQVIDNYTNSFMDIINEGWPATYPDIVRGSNVFCGKCGTVI